MPIRPFVKDDIPQVAALHHRVFGDRRKYPQLNLPDEFRPRYYSYLERVFLANPWFDDELPSLVSERPDGRLVGFLGVVPRPFSWDGRPVRVAVSTQFMVDPDSTSHGAGLLMRFFAGAQDMSVADDSNRDGRRIWQAAGGSVAFPYSVRWTRPLRPARFAASVIPRKPALRPAAWAVRLTSGIVDPVLVRMFPHRFDVSSAAFAAGPLLPQVMVNQLPALASWAVLRPAYDQRSVEWVLESLRLTTRFGSLRQVVVPGANGTANGWYVYYLKPSGTSTVLQAVGNERTVGGVLDHLFQDARRHGSLAVSGIVQPTAIHEFVDRNCLFDVGHPWMLVHSRHRDLLSALQTGTAFFSALDGEWPLRLPSETAR